MRRPAQVPLSWSSAPLAILATVALLLLAGIGVILQSEASYRELQEQETRVQADILAASVTAALDFGDARAAQEAVDVLRVNREIRTIGVYDRSGARIAGYGRDGADPPPRLDRPFPVPASLTQASVPVTRGGERIGAVYLAADAEPLSRRLSRNLVIVLLVVMAVLVVAVLGFAQAALRRANRELLERADALAEANTELRVQIGEREKAEDQLRQAQKLQALGQLTGGIAHDFNNLLTVIQGSADMLRRPGLAEEKRARMAEAIVQSADRAAALTGQLLAFARRQPLQPEVIDVNALIEGMTDLLDRTLGERIAVRTELAVLPCAVEADRAQLESALLNIAVNARDAMPDGGTLTIRTAATDNMVGVSVSDSGSGMDEETLTRAIEPFFTTKATGKGTGLGLSQVYGFATQSGGDVRIVSAPGAGTTVTLLLPCSGGQAVRPNGDGARRIASGRTGRILLVEDNDEVGEFAAILLGELGHDVTRVRSGRKALETAASAPFDAVFSDVVMPGMSGLELAEALREAHPELPVILTTGFSDEIAEGATGGRPLILKPYRLETLAAALDEALTKETP
ncbi:ATP-binding protein [Sphingosinicella sp. LHD-64]|uniref:ATP-binding protein n=1 Tax=Sphingosinicella sp. LHD-64 TaxID=3072139 RepID=UPI00280F80FB|nr:ATP-binding protein [Sphingosinicella sp. LHD-64]MDQ8757764.1 ATP-binding protein [Sphingosinicella sp. LHD-64]